MIVSNECNLTDEEIENRLKEAIEKEDIWISLMSISFPTQENTFEQGFENNRDSSEKSKLLRIMMKNKNEYTTFEWRNK